MRDLLLLCLVLFGYQRVSIVFVLQIIIQCFQKGFPVLGCSSHVFVATRDPAKSESQKNHQKDLNKTGWMDAVIRLLNDLLELYWNLLVRFREWMACWGLLG